MEMKALVEALLFVWGDPLSIRELAKLTGETPGHMKKICEELTREKDVRTSGLRVKWMEDSLQLVSDSSFADYYANLVAEKKPSKLSNSAMETLTIIAYRQPVTRMQIDHIRGVRSQSSLDTLTERGLIEEKGRLEQIGRPILYGTTQKFLQYFDLSSLDDLPNPENENAN